MMKFIPEPLREGEGMGGGAAAAPADGGGGAGASAGGGDPAPWKAPAGLPDQVIGKDANETLAKLVPIYAGLRTELANRGAVPKEPGAYDIKFSETAAPILNIQNDDKVLPILKQAMHKHGITDRQSGFVSDLVDGLISSGLVPKPQDPNEMWKAMAPENFKGSDIEKIAEGQKRMREAQAAIDGLKGRPGWDDAMLTELQLLTGSSAGLKIIQAFQGAGVIKSVAVGGAGGGASGVSKADLDARRHDPRNQYGNPKYDPAFAAETEAMYKRLYSA